VAKREVVETRPRGKVYLTDDLQEVRRWLGKECRKGPKRAGLYDGREISDTEATESKAAE
jgi:hypothetical protein